MIKSFPIVVFMVIGAIASSLPKAIAQEEAPLPTVESHEAAALITQPVTIDSTWNNISNQSETLKEQTISVTQERGCQNLNPLDLLSNADTILKECSKPTDNRSPQKVEPVDYLKVPSLDSGVRMTVTKF